MKGYILTSLCVHFFSPLQPTSGLSFPGFGTGSWSLTPSIHDPTESRSTQTTIFLTWSQGVHSIEPIAHYQLQARYPTSVSPYDALYFPQPTQTGYYPTDVPGSRPWVRTWSAWADVYVGMGRQYLFDVGQFSGLTNQRVYDFQVRAVSVAGSVSNWSAIVPAHTVLEGGVDRLVIEIIGTSMNNAGLTSITIGGTSVYSRRDLWGLTLAVFDRRDFSLVLLDTFDTFHLRTESTRMANAIRSNGTPDTVLMVVSNGAWERYFTPTLASAMEEYGAFYVGQWGRTFDSNSIQPSQYADLAGTASTDSFAHPYAFVGMFGLGFGNGYESLQLNTGHYLTTGMAEKAVIRLGMYFNYMFGHYMVTSDGASAPLSADWFVKSQPPRPGSVHAPIPTAVRSSVYEIQAQPGYAPYIGNLHNQIEFLMESNETVVLDQYNTTNFGFEIRQDNVFSQIITDYPTNNLLETELEFVWGGPSIRYSSNVTAGSPPLPTSATTNTVRVCPSILPYLWMDQLSSVSQAACPLYDDPTATGSVPMLQYGVGVWPTACATSRDGCDPSVTPPVFGVIGKTAIGASVTVTTDTWV